MVLPIVAGIGATVIALTAKATIAAYRQYLQLTPAMIATLNNIKLTNYDAADGASAFPHMTRADPRFEHYRYLRAKYPNRPFADPMTEQEALLVLGIEGNDILNVDKKMIRDRYRRLMVLNHPDKKGSEYLSQRINEAKDVLDRSYMVNK
ncbi:Mitochondrial DnaJ 2 [Candida viswanathii]|uniref:Mitochondrial DnaJ 2 n=1 Tax=Candida viswanathii TaxID=5486 RepID=A0A367YNS3_9ASCO|nr:Mitochondrial DnaJ 2 [Candida viswanathii]